MTLLSSMSVKFRVMNRNLLNRVCECAALSLIPDIDMKILVDQDLERWK